MSLQKELCLICALPTADGAILAVHVDKEKLDTWILNVCGHELAEEIEDHDLICYFCLWHAEFQRKFDEMADESLVWWPRNSENLDDVAKELRKNYFEGKLEQCWVQLKKIELPKSADGEEEQIVEVEIRPRRWNCIYCEKTFKYSYQLSGHLKKTHKEAIRCSGGLADMSFQKMLCLICERPTADGAIPAVQVDKEKLETWILNVCGHELAEEIEDHDLICYFCLWHAEFQRKFDEMLDESLVWWPRNSEYLDDAAKELRKNYFEGKLEQCWVQLKKIELPKSADGEEGRIVEAEIRPRRWNCIYCEKTFKYSFQLSGHVKKTHKEAIRCSGGQSEMSLQKELCLICERPTADGAVLAVHVDKEKLDSWILNVCGHELAEEIEDQDLICYFCLWHAEFQRKFDEMADESLVWWPRNSEYLDDAAKELRKNYFEGKLEQCWVQLKKIELPQNGSYKEVDMNERNIRRERKRFWRAIRIENRLLSGKDSDTDSTLSQDGSDSTEEDEDTNRKEDINLPLACVCLSLAFFVYAAHCVDQKGSPLEAGSLVAALGKELLNSGWTKDDGVSIHSVRSVIKHEEYDHNLVKNDIALLQLTRSVETTITVSPLCLWYKSSNFELLNNINGTVSVNRIIKIKT
ncbi:Hypothetical predicted protein [Cloeon dipterum]|uniref:C2H2-type domain-containing protein n=1 Tax=Cloeon dipterum TaxID=197152 RepID=A0A8S1E5X7_9INSE|nr:Hypothetical predicted protein [Cloeon dipterum]